MSQELTILAGVFSALTGVLVTVIGALCWFLRRQQAALDAIHSQRIPAMIQAFKEEQIEERRLCREQIEALTNRHQELLSELREIDWSVGHRRGKGGSA